MNRVGVEQLLKHFGKMLRTGEAEGFVYGIKFKDGTFETACTDSLNFIERLGLGQALLNDIHSHANRYLDEEEHEGS